MAELGWVQVLYVGASAGESRGILRFEAGNANKEGKNKKSTKVSTRCNFASHRALRTAG